MPKLTGFRPSSFDSIPLGPGVAVANVTSITPANVLAAIRGDETAGRRLGAMTAAPSFSAEPEIVDLMENIVGAGGAVKGSKQVQSVAATATISLAELSHDNLHLIHPMLDQSDWTGESPDGGTTPGAVVGQKFTPRAYFEDTDYTDNIVLAMESARQDIFSLIVLKNVLNTEAFELSLEDDGAVAGIEATLTAHATDADFDPTTGAFAPGYEIYIADLEPVA